MSAAGASDDHERYRDELAGYALGALEPDEAAAMERHLAGCAKCRERLDWLRPALDVVPASVEQLSPPPALRERVLSAVRRDARRTRAGESRGELRWLSRRGLAARPATTLAALALLAGAATAGYALRKETEPERTVIAAQATVVAPRGEVAAALETADGSATLHVSQLPKLRPDRAYQIWIQRGGRMQPSSVFRVGRDRRAEVAVGGELEGARRLLITEEPAGGSTSPTSPPLLSADLS